jgi:hypothetical protein
VILRERDKTSEASRKASIYLNDLKAGIYLNDLLFNLINI